MFPFRKMRLKISSAKWMPFCPEADDLMVLDFFSRKCGWKCRLQNAVHFVPVSPCKSTRNGNGRTHWGRVICVSKLTTIGSDYGLSPGRCQAIIWANAGILLIGPLGTNFSGILIEILTFSFKKMHLKMSSGRCRPFCLCLNVLNVWS